MCLLVGPLRPLTRAFLYLTDSFLITSCCSQGDIHRIIRPLRVWSLITLIITLIIAKLAQLALDLLAILAMPAEDDRVFSSTGKLITADRNQLHEDSIEAVECLRHWYTTL